LPDKPQSYAGYLLPEGNIGSSAHIPFELCYGKTWSVSVEYPPLFPPFVLLVLTHKKYEFEEEIAQYLYFLRKELAEFKKNSDGEGDLDAQKENSKQRAFAIIGKQPGSP